MVDKRVSMSKKIGQISDKAKVLWFMILPHLDREGRIAFDDLEDLKDEIIPKFRNWQLKTISAAINELADKKLVDLYKDGKNIAISYVKFEDFQAGLRKDREAPSKVKAPTPVSSGVLRITPALRLNKRKEVKVKEEKNKNNMSEKTSSEFDALWKSWPGEGRFKKDICRKKFKALIKAGKLERFKKTTQGYASFLKHKKERENFDQRVMHLSTWLNNWEGEEETYSGFKYKPGL